MKIAVIPARGGSKRIPRKNIRTFVGLPMLAWPVSTALASGCFDRVIVSTDDPEIAAVANKLSAETPFLRSADLADEYTGLIAVMRDAIGKLRCSPEDSVCCLYPTAAFVQPADLQAGLQHLECEEYEFSVGVTAFRAPIDRALHFDNNGQLAMLDPTRYRTRSQDLSLRYHDAGQFCWGRAGAWLRYDNVFQARCAGVVVPSYRAHDIDTEEDWILAETMFEAMRCKPRGASD